MAEHPLAGHQDKLENLTILGVTETGEEFGRGAYATVLKLKYRGLKCAGKKLHILYRGGTGGIEKQRIIRRFSEECQLLSDLKHPNIVQFLGVHFENVSGAPVLVMEYLHTTLSKCLDEHKPLSEEMCCSILKDVATALCYLHGSTPVVIHRDMSANNVLLTANMTAKLSDLGMAKILGLTPAKKHQMTTCPGTLAYMPPEALEHNPEYSTEIDCFSFGVLMIHVFSGEWPIPDRPVRRDVSGKRVVLTEVERREKYLQTIVNDHPVMNSLVTQCLGDVNRPKAEDILQLIEEEASKFPPHFQNTLMMFRENQELRTQVADEQNDSHTVQAHLDETSMSVEQNTLTRQESVTVKVGYEEKEMESRTRSESLLTEKLELQKKLEKAEELNNLRDGVHKCDIQQATSENFHLKSRLRSAEDQLQSKTKEQETWKVTLESKTKQLDIKAELLEIKEAQLLKSEEVITVLKQTNESSKKEIEAKRRELEAKDKELKTIQTACNEVLAQVNAMQEQRDAMQEKSDYSRRELELYQEKVELIQEEMQQASAYRAELEREIESKNETIKLRDTEIENLTSFTISNLQSQLQVNDDTVKQLMKRQKKMQDYFAAKGVSTNFSLKFEVKPCANLPVAMCDPQCAVVNDTVYVGGGLTDSKLANEGQGEVFEYNQLENKWNTLPTCLTRRFGLAHFCGKLLTMGGITKSNMLSGSVCEFNRNTDTWEVDPIPPFPTKRFFPAIVSHGSILAVCGGVIQGGSLTDNVEVFKDGGWHTASRLPHRCALAKPVIIGDSCFLMGGYFSLSPDVPSKAVISVRFASLVSTKDIDKRDKSSWELYSDEECRITQYKSVPANCGGMLLAIGGWDQNNLVSKSDILTYSFHTGMWRKVDNLPSPRASSSATIQLQNGSIMIAGGIEKGNKKTATSLLLCIEH